MSENSEIVLSIVIVNWNTKKLLEDCLNSIYNDDKQFSIEVLVVDNSSSDGSVEMVKQKFPWVKLIENKENVGFSIGNNQGISKSKGKYILLLNSDTVVLNGSLNKIIEFAENHQDAGIVGCKLLNPDNTPQHSCGTTPFLLMEFLHRTMLDLLFPSIYYGQFSFEKTMEVNWVTGACLLVRREIINKIGGLDEKIFMYLEDIDLCHRVKKSGWKIYYTPTAKIIHYQRASSKKNIFKTNVEGCYSSYYFFRKHYGYWHVKILQGIILFGMIIRIIAFSIFFVLSPKNREATSERIKSFFFVIKKSIENKEFVWGKDT